MNWAAEESEAVQLGDKRLNCSTAQQQAGWRPKSHSEDSCGLWTLGLHGGGPRLLDNERCDWHEIIEARGRCVVQRITGLPVMLCLDESTELDFNGQTIQGLGPLSYEAQRGMYLHAT